MLNLTPHHRLHIPNGLAIFAAVLLIGSSLVGVSSNQDDPAAVNKNDIIMTAKHLETDINDIGNVVKQTSHALKLGLRLFRL